MAAALVFGVLFLLWRVESPRRDGPGWLLVGGLLLLVFLAGMAYVAVRQSAAQGTVAALVESTNSQGQEGTIEGTIIREPDVREGRAAYIVRAHMVNGSAATGLVLVVDYRKEASSFEHGGHSHPPHLEYGDRISARGRLQKPKAASNPGEFDYAAYLARQGIYATLSIWDGGTLQKRGPNTGNQVIKSAIATKNRLEQVLRQTLPEPHSSLLAGLLFGSRSNLPEEMQDDFRSAGVYHILPLSYARKRKSRIAT